MTKDDFLDRLAIITPRFDEVWADLDALIATVRAEMKERAAQFVETSEHARQHELDAIAAAIRTLED